LYRKADVVAAVSSDVRDDLASNTGIPREQIVVLHNPVVASDIQDLAVAPIDHPWLVGSGPPVVLGVGRFSAQKNFQLLIDAFAALRKNRRARLIILGDGELRKELEARIQYLGLTEDVDLPGFDPNPFRFMRRASVYVLCSAWEGLPTALIEALACGTPVVATDCPGGVREILRDGAFGRISPVGDPTSLASCIAATLDSPGDREDRIRRGSDFGVEKAVRRYLSAAGWH
jgi:glycosyltransferase involved in cell wall biosynthesis